MNRTLRDQYCKKCVHCLFDVDQGLLCDLSKMPPNFESTCPAFKEDTNRIEQIQIQENLQQKINQADNSKLLKAAKTIRIFLLIFSITTLFIFSSFFVPYEFMKTYYENVAFQVHLAFIGLVLVGTGISANKYHKVWRKINNDQIDL